MPKRKSLPNAALYRRAFDETLRPADPNSKHLPVLHRTKVDGRRRYISQGSLPLPQNSFDSVSTILNSTQDEASKAALCRWQARVGAMEAERIRNEAIDAGKAIHTYLHNYLTGKHCPPIGSSYEGYFHALEKVLPKFEESFLSEQTIVSFQYQYLGTLDLLVRYQNRITLIEIKTSSKSKQLDWVKDKVLQLAAYQIPAEELYPIEQSALIYLIGDGSYQEFLFTPQQMTYYKQLWLNRLAKARVDWGFAS